LGERRIAPERRVDVVVVVRVVTMVRARLEDRGHPDDVDSESFEIAELLLDSLEIAAEEVAIEDAGALWVLDRLVPRLMERRGNRPVERRTSSRATGAAVVVARVPVPKAVGEDREHHGS